jgi:hypothetical protein
MNPSIRKQNKSIAKKKVTNEFGIPVNNFTFLSSPGKQIVPHGTLAYESNNLPNWDFRDWTLDSAPALDSTNFITGDNHDFESGTGSWTANTGTFVQSSGQAYEGTYSGKITYGTNYYVAYLSITGISQHALYELTVKMYSPSTNSTSSVYATCANLSGASPKGQIKPTATDQWVESRYVFKTATDVNGTISVYMPDGVNGDVLYIDDVVLKQVGSLGHYIFDKSYEREDRNKSICSERTSNEAYINDSSYASGVWNHYTGNWEIGVANLAAESSEEIDSDSNYKVIPANSSLGWWIFSEADYAIGDVIRFQMTFKYTKSGSGLTVILDGRTSGTNYRESYKTVSMSAYTVNEWTTIDVVSTVTNADVTNFMIRMNGNGDDEGITISSLSVTKLPDNSLLPVGFSQGFEDEYLNSGVETSLVTNGGAADTTDWIGPYTDGRADGWLQVTSSTCIWSIVTGNGFTGNAQRFVEDNAGNHAIITTGGFQSLETGKTYKFSCKYRSSGAFRLRYFTGQDILVDTINTGDAKYTEVTFTHLGYHSQLYLGTPGVASSFLKLLQEVLYIKTEGRYGLMEHLAI